MNGRVYYNEHDGFAAAWLCELIADGLIPAGDVDERDIRDVQPADLDSYAACHFFAGIGGWPYALRLAGWPDDRPVWTGSCPCQPFSAAGRGGGFADERHLWPAFFHLIEQCRPATVFGEQVASKDGLSWLDLVQSDLEGAGYAVGAADLPAAGVGAPHIRQRLWWVADSDKSRPQGRVVSRNGTNEWAAGSDRLAGAVGHASCAGSGRDAGAISRPQGEGDCQRQKLGRVAHEPVAAGSMVDAEMHGARTRQQSSEQAARGRAVDRGSSPWADVIWLPCRDGKTRPTQPGLQPLAHGVSNRVGTLRGAGNAIVPALAAEFVRACL